MCTVKKIRQTLSEGLGTLELKQRIMYFHSEHYITAKRISNIYGLYAFSSNRTVQLEEDGSKYSPA